VEIAETQVTSLDDLLPAEMAAKAADVGAKKANMDAVGTLTLGVLAGAFIGLGAAFATTTPAGATAALPFGVTRLPMGMISALGLILVSSPEPRSSPGLTSSSSRGHNDRSR
jgi:formate/nitrite transporter FocA (FNT family)